MNSAANHLMTTENDDRPPNKPLLLDLALDGGLGTLQRRLGLSFTSDLLISDVSDRHLLKVNTNIGVTVTPQSHTGLLSCGARNTR